MDARRLEALEAVLDRLRREAVGAGVIVEGRKDVAALVALGIGGAHVVVNRGMSLDARIDRLVARAEEEGWRRVILLMDWDRTGDRLQRRLAKGLAGRCVIDEHLRKELATWSHTSSLEEVPADLASLRQRVGN